MEKKIGILTFHNCVNYGAVMQAYGLQSFLESKGYDVEIVDYVNEKIDSELNAKIEVSFSLKSIARYIAKSLHRARKRGQFLAFNNSFLNLSKQKNITINQIGEYASTYDVLITGSDQVWNLNLTGNDMTYYLDFASPQTCKISYAASVGDISKVNIGAVLKEIKAMDHISVREKSFLDYITKEYGIDATLCCDPTILCDEKCFYDISDYRLSKEKYIFIFLMEDKPGIVAFAKELARKMGYKVINNKTSLEFFAHSKPTDFLSWIRNAEYVLTDSFHGTVFSVLFRKQFLSDRFDGKRLVKSRIKDLLEGFDLEAQFQDISEKKFNELATILRNPIDYEAVDDRVSTLVAESRDWLLMALKE